MGTATINFARAIERKYGTNYYVATLFLPKKMRSAVFILYAFVRIPDEIVDNPAPGTDPAQLLNDWRHTWQETFETGKGTNDIMLATREIFIEYDIPFSVSLEFIEAMIRDLTQTRYQTYDELRTYMRGSAEAVGVMLTYVFGYTDKRAFPYGEKLGEAMQLTNFLRDFFDDLTTRNRIYIPQEDLERYGVTEAMIRNGKPTPQLIKLLKFEIERNRTLYKEAEPGIALLHKDAQNAVTLASRFYSGILNEIERQNYDIFFKVAHLNLCKKVTIMIQAYVRK